MIFKKGYQFIRSDYYLDEVNSSSVHDLKKFMTWICKMMDQTFASVLI